MSAVQRISGARLSCALMLVLALKWVSETGGTKTVALDAQAFGQHLKTFSNDVMGARRMQVTNMIANRMGTGRIVWGRMWWNDEGNMGWVNRGRGSQRVGRSQGLKRQNKGLSK